MIEYDAFQTKTEHFWTKKRTFLAIKVRKQPIKQLKALILENRKLFFLLFLLVVKSKKVDNLN